MNYLHIRGQVNENNKIESFINFFDLVKWTKKDKLNYLYANFYNYLNFFSLAGDKQIEKYSVQEFFEENIYLKLSEEELELEKVYIIVNKKFSVDDFFLGGTFLGMIYGRFLGK